MIVNEHIVGREPKMGQVHELDKHPIHLTHVDIRHSRLNIYVCHSMVHTLSLSLKIHALTPLNVPLLLIDFPPAVCVLCLMIYTY